MKKFKITSIITAIILTISFCFITFATFQGRNLSDLSTLSFKNSQGMWDLTLAFDSSSSDAYIRKINIFGIISFILIFVSILFVALHLSLNIKTKQKPALMDTFLYVLLIFVIAIFLIGITAIPSTAINGPNNNLSWIFEIVAEDSLDIKHWISGIITLFVTSALYVLSLGCYTVGIFMKPRDRKGK